MGSDFRILIHSNSDSLHLKLAGHFDEISAGKLVSILNRYGDQFSTIFIHTNALQRVAYSGRKSFQDGMVPLEKQNVRIIFTGEYASSLSA